VSDTPITTYWASRLRLGYYEPCTSNEQALVDAMQGIEDRLTVMTAAKNKAVDALKIAADLICQYEKPRTDICGKSSVSLRTIVATIAELEKVRYD